MIRERKDLLASSVALILIAGGLLWFEKIGATILAGFLFVLGIWGLGCTFLATDRFLIKNKPTKEKLVQAQPKVLWSLVVIMLIILIAVIAIIK